MAQELEPTAKHPGLRADAELVLSLFSPERAQAVMKWVDSWHDRADERARTAFKEASDAAGMSADELLESIMDEERLTDLFRSAMELASRTGNEQKLRALGRALATGALASDDAKVDEAQLLLRTIGEMEPADVRALSNLSQGRGGLSTAPVTNVDYLIDAEPYTAPLPVRVHLSQLGLAEQRLMVIDGGDPMGVSSVASGREMDTNYSFEITPYGMMVLAFLSENWNA